MLKLTAISYTISIPRPRCRLKRTFNFARLWERIRENLKITHPGVQTLSTIVQPLRSEYPLRLSQWSADTQRVDRFDGSGLSTVSKPFVNPATQAQIASNVLAMANGVRRSERNVYSCQDETIARSAFLFASPILIYVRCWVLQQSVCELASIQLSDNCVWPHPRTEHASVKAHTDIELQTLHGQRAENKMGTDLLLWGLIILWY